MRKGKRRWEEGDRGEREREREIEIKIEICITSDLVKKYLKLNLVKRKRMCARFKKFASGSPTPMIQIMECGGPQTAFLKARQGHLDHFLVVSHDSIRECVRPSVRRSVSP